MARPILDSLVQSKAMDASLYLDIVSNTNYIGNVETGKPKITLEDSKLGLSTEHITAALASKYAAVKSDEPGTLTFKLDGGEKVVPVTGKELSMLKALAVEQISLHSEYSEIVTGLFWQLLKKVAFGEGGEMPFTMPVDASKLRTVVTNRFAEYILNEVQ